jgi:hypothetical protein
MQKPISEEEVQKFKDELRNLRPDDIIKGLKDKEGHKKEKPEQADDPPDDEEPDDEEHR